MISTSLADVLGHPTGDFAPEDIIVVHCSPQSVFRVRPATRCSFTISGHTSPILCASFSSTGRLHATGSGDTNARLWDLDTETSLQVPPGHKGWVLCVEWCDYGIRRLASPSEKGHSKGITSLSWEPVHYKSTVTTTSFIFKRRIWSTLTRRTEYTLGGHSPSVNVVKWGGQVVLMVFCTPQAVIVHVLPAQTLAKARYDALLRTTPELLISGSDDHTLFLWSPSSPSSSGQHFITKPMARLTGHQRQISHVAFSPDGRWAASAAWDSSKNPDEVPSTVQNLLLSTKRLQEVLHLWSVEQATEGDVSDVYVKIGNELNLTISAFAQHQIDMSDIHSIPGDLRVVLERCLSEDPSPEVLETFMPEVRDVLFKMLKSLHSRQESWRLATQGRVRHSTGGPKQ
ncbi:WD40 repeat-like protein [Phlegmacium glaucopus]|nr:WD40 repeat-like protein [Phlegmacium glaucopus]